MIKTNPQPGHVIDYFYLWARENKKGETEGRKERPCVLAISFNAQNPETVLLFPITSQPQSGTALEIPELEKQRAGLEKDKPLWVVLDEFNADVIGQSYYLKLDNIRGRFSDAFLERIVQTILDSKNKKSAISRA